MSRLTLAPGTTTASDGRTFTSLGLQCVVNAFVYSTYLARLPDIRDQAHLSIGAMGVVMMVGNLAGFVASSSPPR
jgi:isocitrate dehydrogenase kinase/phosphatase